MARLLALLRRPVRVLYPAVAEALEKVREQASFFKVFGSYPRYVPPA